MSEYTNPENPATDDSVPESVDLPVSEPTPDFLSIADEPVDAPAPTDFSTADQPSSTEPFQAPPGLDVGNPEEVAQATYGQTQEAYTGAAASAPSAPQPDPQASYAPPPPPPVAPVYAQTMPGQMSVAEENTWASAAHWSALLATIVGLGFLGPLLIMLIKGPESPRVRSAAVESLNFEITYIISMLASVLLMFIFIGLITIFIFPIIWLVLRIIASIAASKGEDYRYPLNIRLVK
jgi:uncharacterized protein